MSDAKQELVNYVRALDDEQLVLFLRALFHSDNDTLKRHADAIVANRGGVHMRDDDATARASQTS